MKKHIFATNLLGTSLAITFGLALLPSCHRSSSDSSSTMFDTVIFDTRQEIATKGNNPMGLALVDLDGDKRLDLAVGNSGSDTVQTMIADSVGSFQVDAGHTLAAKGAPSDIVAADFNGDENQDLAALRVTDGKVSIFIGDGKGGLGSGAVVELNAGTNPSCLLAADLDKDSLVDLVVSDLGGGRLFFHPGKGNGTFGPVVEIPLDKGSQPLGMAAADFDQDGTVDLAVADFSANEITLRTLTKAGSVSLFKGAAIAGITAVDINGDGWMDLVGVSPVEQKVYTLINGSTGWLGLPEVTSLNGCATWVKAADLDDDGVQDLVVTYPEEMSIALLKGNGLGSFTQTAVLPTTGLPWRLALADVTGDGRIDILVSASMSEVISIFHGVEGGFVNGGRAYGNDFQEPFFVVASDVNGDNMADLVVSDRKRGEITFLRSTGTGFVKEKSYDVGNYSGNIVKGDFNADGLEDLAVALHDGVRIFQRMQASGFDFTVVPPLTSPPFQAGPGPFEVLATDMDQDGLPELVSADLGGESVTVLKGQAGMSFTALQKVSIKNKPLGLANGDFNGDGLMDLALSRFEAGKLVILPGKGNGTLASPIDITVDAQPCYVRAADFNKDGRMDLVVSSMGGNSISLLLNQQDFAFSLTRIDAGLEPTAVIAQDMNQDENPDLLVATLESGEFRILLGDGLGGFSTIKVFPGVRGAMSADLGDINQDGLPDLVLGSLYSKRVTCFKNISK